MLISLDQVYVQFLYVILHLRTLRAEWDEQVFVDAQILLVLLHVLGHLLVERSSLLPSLLIRLLLRIL